MKVPIILIAISAALVSAGCGDSDAGTASGEKNPGPPPAAERKVNGSPSASDRRADESPPVSERDDPRFATVTFGESRDAIPKIDPPDRPSPGKLLVRDLEVGSGPVARTGAEVGVFYIGVAYETGEKRFQTWPPTAHPFFVRLRAHGRAEAWEDGIKGMREGGRREVLVPSRLAFGDGALDYVFVMARVEPAARALPGG